MNYKFDYKTGNIVGGEALTYFSRYDNSLHVYEDETHVNILTNYYSSLSTLLYNVGSATHIKVKVMTIPAAWKHQFFTDANIAKTLLIEVLKNLDTGLLHNSVAKSEYFGNVFNFIMKYSTPGDTLLGVLEELVDTTQYINSNGDVVDVTQMAYQYLYNAILARYKDSGATLDQNTKSLLNSVPSVVDRIAVALTLLDTKGVMLNQQGQLLVDEYNRRTEKDYCAL